MLLCIGPDDCSIARFNVWNAMCKVSSDKPLCIDGEYADDAVYALVIKNYSYPFLKRQEGGEIKKVRVHAPNNRKILGIANSQNIARFLGDTPGNLLTPKIFADYIKDYFSSTEGNFELSLLGKEFIEREKMNLILSVSKGSAKEPVFIHAKYFGRESSKIDLALVGKGVTFDTGGISLKPAGEMYKLKQDMMGAAILTCVMKLIMDNSLKINVSLVLPLVENMPSGNATKPGDVFTSLSGKTVEIDNTDAEGRLILADALTFAQRDKPRFVFDVATLTGAIRVALGNVFGAYFTDDERLSTLIDKCSDLANDHLWRMPLSDQYGDNLKKGIADLCNMSRVPGGGGSAAASFLKEFIEEGTSWVHFDVSNIRNGHFQKNVFGDQTTGRPLPTLFKIIEELQGML
ncbi:bleomycin hydrolase [Glugoides intestinalis]